MHLILKLMDTHMKIENTDAFIVHEFSANTNAVLKNVTKKGIAIDTGMR